jgi:hypothetical protein
MRTYLCLIVSLSIYCASASAQSYCLTGAQVKKINYLLDDRDYLIQLSIADSFELVGYQREVEATNQLLIQSRNEAANLDTLRTLAVDRSEQLSKELNKAEKRVKRRERLLWIVGTVAAVETVVIGLYVGLR